MGLEGCELEVHTQEGYCLEMEGSVLLVEGVHTGGEVGQPNNSIMGRGWGKW